MTFPKQPPLSIPMGSTFRHALDQSSQTDQTNTSEVPIYYKTKVTKKFVDIQRVQVGNIKKYDVMSQRCP